MRAALPLLVLACLAAPAGAAWRDMSAADFTVPPPPAPGSAGDQEDFATLLKLQAARSPEQCALATKQKIPDFLSLFADSGLLTPAELKAVQPFADEVSTKASKVTGVFKKKYSRPRPYDEDARVQPCADKPGGATAYPSGHATSGVVDACVLSAIFPDRAEKLAQWGRYAGDLRVISGVHHPTDVSAGQALGAAICARLNQEADFQAEAAKLRDAVKP